MPRSRVALGWIVTAVLVTAAMLLVRAPENVHQRLRSIVLDALKPGMSTIVSLQRRDHLRNDNPGSPEQLHDLTRQLQAAQLHARRMEIEMSRLREELDQLQSEQPKPFVGETGLPLFAPNLLAARVLETPSTEEIERTILTLDEGHTARVALAEWVLSDDGVTIDQGQDANVRPDSPVLSGRSVFGRVASTGWFTSRVQHVSDPAFRAHAKLVRRAGERTVSGSEGLLVGAGEGVCRLELIAATEPVAPGDMVVTAATIPGIDGDLYLGEVESAELTAGALHWSIHVRPAVSVSNHEQLQVVRIGLHPGRATVETADNEEPKKTVELTGGTQP